MTETKKRTRKPKPPPEFDDEFELMRREFRWSTLPNEVKPTANYWITEYRDGTYSARCDTYDWIKCEGVEVAIGVSYRTRAEAIRACKRYEETRPGFPRGEAP